MNEKEFRALVKEMMDAQQNYFKTRDRAWLTTSKELERKVRRELDSPQQSLFQKQ